jgi:hypothetical protein
VPEKYLLGIYREPEYSPGRHTSNDAQILRLVGQALQRDGVTVRLADLEEARDLWRGAQGIFSMCQGPAALAELSEWKKQGARITNDPAASLSTYRQSLCRRLELQTLPFPRSVVLSTDQPIKAMNFFSFFQSGPAWLKRADVHATEAADVACVPNVQDLPTAVAAFQGRGLHQVILQENVAGDEVKFYAVRGGKLFWPFYPKDCVGHPFDENMLKRIADDAARLLDLHVYGGDAIISPNGTITLIDVNDWPSFAPCRGAAAHAIARHLKEIYVTENRRTTTLSAS